MLSAIDVFCSYGELKTSSKCKYWKYPCYDLIFAISDLIYQHHDKRMYCSPAYQRLLAGVNLLQDFKKHVIAVERSATPLVNRPSAVQLGLHVPQIDSSLRPCQFPVTWPWRLCLSSPSPSLCRFLSPRQSQLGPRSGKGSSAGTGRRLVLRGTLNEVGT